MKSIKTKLIIYFSILIMVSSIILGYISIRRASIALVDDAEKALNTLAVEVARLTESRIETQIRTLEMIAMREDINSMNWELQQRILQWQTTKTNFLDIAIAWPDGTTYYPDGTISQLGDRDYVRKALSGEISVSDLIVSRETDKPVFMYAVPIERDGKVVGALIGRRDADALNNIISDAGFGNSGYAYMINTKGIVVAHPDKDRVLSQWNPIDEAKNDKTLDSVALLFEKILQDKRGVSSYSFQGNDLYAAYAPIEETEWIVVVTANKSEVLSSIPVIQKNIIEIVVVILLVCIVLVYLLGNSITNPIIEVVQHCEKIASLDITQDIPKKYLKKKDETGKLVASMLTITNSLKQIVGEINSSSEQVAAASEELTASTQQLTTTAEEVSKTVGEIASSASDQAQDIQKGSSKASSLGMSIEKDQEYLSNLNSASNKIKGVVEEGLQEIDNLLRITEESNVTVKEIYEVILKTCDSSDKIGQASNLIASIAEQTNLLALNAAIEAAREGGTGKGFAVVAEEIKKLAQQSSISTKEINGIVSELQNNAQNTVKTMNRVSDITREQADSVIKSRDKYMLIAQAMNDVINAVEQLNASGQEMENLKNDIIDTLQNLSAIAEENSAATEQMAAAMQEQTASFEEIANASEGLSSLAQDLQSIIKKFKVL